MNNFKSFYQNLYSWLVYSSMIQSNVPCCTTNATLTGRGASLTFIPFRNIFIQKILKQQLENLRQLIAFSFCSCDRSWRAIIDNSYVVLQGHICIFSASSFSALAMKKNTQDGKDEVDRYHIHAQRNALFFQRIHSSCLYRFIILVIWTVLCNLLNNKIYMLKPQILANFYCFIDIQQNWKDLVF